MAHKKIDTVLITGGAGFIGSNTAEFYLKKGKKVIVLDNLSRPGSRKNLAWLKSLPGRLEIIQADVRNFTSQLINAFASADAVIHLAAQVAVTTSVSDPREDFEINLLGTFNVLEAIRTSKNHPPLLFASTNKVYGGMESVKVKKISTRYSYTDYPYGISESFPVDFHSPYGCSKGAADQYVRDYSRIYNLKTVVFRQSSIYGPHQFGVEDQGWVAWFIIAIATGKPITIYGDGFQVRDVLYVEDLVRAYDLTLHKIDSVSGEIFNIGGGRKFGLSVWEEFKPVLEKHFHRKIVAKKSEWRPGDQKIYISDIRKAAKLLGWAPQVSVSRGIRQLYDWVSQNSSIL